MRYLKLAFNSGEIPKYRKSEIGNTLAWCYILLGLNNEAREILEEVVPYSSMEHVSILLNILFTSKKSESIPEELTQAVTLAPMDRRVFNNVVLLGRARVEQGQLKV